MVRVWEGGEFFKWISEEKGEDGDFKNEYHKKKAKWT